MARNELAMLERIDYHRRKLLDEGKTSSASEEWVALERRRLEKLLGGAEA
jgi:hypothetical protein